MQENKEQIPAVAGLLIAGEVVKDLSRNEKAEAL